MKSTARCGWSVLDCLVGIADGEDVIVLPQRFRTGTRLEFFKARQSWEVVSNFFSWYFKKDPKVGIWK